MRKIYATLFLVILLMSFNLKVLLAADPIPLVEYGENFIVFEAEATTSSLSKWALRKPGDPLYQKYVTKSTGVDPINETYLEYIGPWNGGVYTELKYTFTCPKSGKYRMLMRMHQPLKDGEAGDQRNDVFVRLHGDYTSETGTTKTELEKNHKFWGRGVNKWGSCHKLEIGSHMNAVYGLKAGEEYTFVMSGRSTGASIDYILFYEDGIVSDIQNNDDIAVLFPENFRPGLGLADPTSLSLGIDTVEIRVGTSLQLTPEWEPQNAIEDAEWASFDATIVSVDSMGMLTANGSIGQLTKVLVQSKITDLADTCVVSIVEWYPTPVDSLDVLPESNNVFLGSSVKLSTKIYPYDADIDSVVWTSSDENIAMVNAYGQVSTKAEGVVNIRATFVNNPEVYDLATIKVAKNVNAYLNYDDDNKYLSTPYVSGDSMEVTIDYHAGTFNTVKNPIKLYLREITSNWKVVKDVLLELDEPVGTESGSITAKIPLNDIRPSAELTSPNFYFLFVKCDFSDGNTKNKGIKPIQIIAADTRIQNMMFEKAFIYPNPAKSSTVSIKGVVAGSYELQIFDVDGKKVHRSLEKIKDHSTYPIKLHGLQPGVYFLIMSSEKENYQSQVILQ